MLLAKKVEKGEKKIKNYIYAATICIEIVSNKYYTTKRKK